MKETYYTLNNQALKFAIQQHNILQCDIGSGIIDKKRIDALDTTSKNIALVKSKFECSKCHNKNKRITFHHLILTCYKDIMPLNIYLMIRHNWKTIIILCKECHQSYHGKNDKGDDIYWISEQRIEKVMRDYFEKTK